MPCFDGSMAVFVDPFLRWIFIRRHKHVFTFYIIHFHRHGIGGWNLSSLKSWIYIPTLSISWLLLTWRLQEPGYRQPWYDLLFLKYFSISTKGVEIPLNGLPFQPVDLMWASSSFIVTMSSYCQIDQWAHFPVSENVTVWNGDVLVVRRAGLLWSQQDFEWRWSVPLFKCLTVLEFSFILFELCLLITFFNFIMNYVPIVTFWIFTYHKIWILSIMFCSIWSYWIIYFLACLEVSWRVVS